ncbi:hypothetical protein [Salinifilum ghardaiensis]
MISPEPQKQRRRFRKNRLHAFLQHYVQPILIGVTTILISTPLSIWLTNGH